MSNNKRQIHVADRFRSPALLSAEKQYTARLSSVVNGISLYVVKNNLIHSDSDEG